MARGLFFAQIAALAVGLASAQTYDDYVTCVIFPCGPGALTATEGITGFDGNRWGTDARYAKAMCNAHEIIMDVTVCACRYCEHEVDAVWPIAKDVCPWAIAGGGDIDDDDGGKEDDGGGGTLSTAFTIAVGAAVVPFMA